MKKLFIKQTHTDFRVLFGIVYLICLALFVLVSVRNQSVHFLTIIFFIVFFILCLYISKLLNSFGVYVNENTIYYKRIKKQPIDTKAICAIKIIKSEIDGKYGCRPVKDIYGNNMYSMIFLSGVTDYMYDYGYGDAMFLHEFKDYILFHTIYDNVFCDYIKTQNLDIIIIN